MAQWFYLCLFYISIIVVSHIYSTDCGNVGLWALQYLAGKHHSHSPVASGLRAIRSVFY